MKNYKLLAIGIIILTTILTNIINAEASMLENKPYFTWRVETKGTLYEGKINGILLEKDFKGNMLAFEQPVNQYMRSGKNRIGFQLYTTTPEDFGSAQITISLYVNDYDAPEQGKKLIGQISFSAAEFAQGKSGITESMPAMRLDSTDDFKVKDNGDVIIHQAVIEPSQVRPHAFHIYQDIEVKTPFPEWGFLRADPIEFPDAFSEYIDKGDYYDEKLLFPLYKTHEKIYSVMKTQDMDKILPLFEERNREYDIAFYYDKGTQEELLKKELIKDFNNEDKVLLLDEVEYASPTVSDNKKLIRLGGKSMIHFEDKENSIWSHYKMWFYKKDGKWIISR